MDRAKVFAIGFHRTGTTSLAAHFDTMGFRSVHYPAIVNRVAFETLAAPLIGNKKAVTDLLQPVLSAFDAFTDVPFPGLYRELFIRYPDAKYILMTRDLDEWWSSLSTHWKLHHGPRILNPFEQIQYEDYLPGLRTVTMKDRDAIKDAHSRHIRACRSFFPNLSLLEVDLADPAKSETISRFVGAVSQEFPHMNRSRPRRSDRMRRTLRRVFLGG